MVSENQEVHAEQIASEASDTPHDASGFELHRGPVLLIVEGGSADVDDGAYGAIRLFLLEGGSEASDASVAMETEGGVVSMTASQSGKTSIGGAASSARRARTVSSIAEVKSNAAPFLRKAIIGRMRRAMLGRNLR